MIEVIGKPGCLWCTEAKKLLNSEGFEYTYRSLGDDYTVEELKTRFPSVRTVPVVVIDSKFIGGYNELTDYIRLQKV